MVLLYLCFALISLIYIFYLVARRSIKMKILFSYATIFVLLSYLIFRGIFTLPFYSISSTILGLLLYAAEITSLIVFMIFVFLFRNQEKAEAVLAASADFQPSVSIFVCTYNEDMKLVIATALAAKMLGYQNKKVYICDDGHRPELKALCDRFEIHYITRDGNEHGKAGNINHALSQTESDLFMILDADFIVKDRFIREAIPHFVDESVALIQYPQSFYNKDPFQLMRTSFYNEQELFMRFIEPQLAKDNALIHVGTNAILRRSAIESIGGIPTNSITEDMATGMLLQSAGYKTVYINKVYALGVTPYTVEDLAKQRERWAKGTMQIFKNYNPLKMKGLSKIQKLFYFNAYLYWYTSFQKMVYILAPTIFLVFNIFIIRSDLNNLVVFFIPPLLMILLSFRLCIPHIRTLSASHIYDTFVAPIHSKAILKEFFKTEKKFQVTNKDTIKEDKFDFKTIRIHLVLFLWLSFALVMGLIKLFETDSFVYGYIVTIAWLLYNLYALAYSILAAKTRGVISDADALSIEINERVAYKDRVYHIYQMSFSGFSMTEIEPDGTNPFEIGEIYNFQDLESDLEISAECKRINTVLEFEFHSLTLEAAERLAVYYSEKLHTPKPVDL